MLDAALDGGELEGIEISVCPAGRGYTADQLKDPLLSFADAAA